MESTWSPVESMWSYGVHMESMGECKVHEMYLAKRSIKKSQSTQDHNGLHFFVPDRDCNN